MDSVERKIQPRRLEIVGVKTMTVESCPECPLFNDSNDWEYIAYCQLTNEEASYRKRFILKGCPLPREKP